MHALKKFVKEARAKEEKMLSSLRKENTDERERLLDTVVDEIRNRLIAKEEELEREKQEALQLVRKEIMQEYLLSTVGWGSYIDENTDEDMWIADTNIRLSDANEVAQAPEDLNIVIDALFGPGNNVTWDMEKDYYYSLVFSNVTDTKVKKRKIADER